MAAPTVQLNVRIAPETHDVLREYATREDLTLAAAVTEAIQLLTQTNGSAATSPKTSSRAASKGA